MDKKTMDKKTKKTKEKAIKKVQSPSKENLGTPARVGLASGGAVLTYFGVRRIKENGWPLAAIGGALSLFALIGKNPLYLFNKKDKRRLQVKASTFINKNKEEVYEFWRHLENLPSFMDHIKEIHQVSDSRSHWVANLQHINLEWDAEITEDVPGSVIAWRSMPDSEVQTQGRVEFRSRNKGTDLTVNLQYADETGQIAKEFASLYKPVFKNEVKAELKRCKIKLETGLKPKLEAQPH